MGQWVKVFVSSARRTHERRELIPRLVLWSPYVCPPPTLTLNTRNRKLQNTSDGFPLYSQKTPKASTVCPCLGDFAHLFPYHLQPVPAFLSLEQACPSHAVFCLLAFLCERASCSDWLSLTTSFLTLLPTTHTPLGPFHCLWIMKWINIFMLNG